MYRDIQTLFFSPTHTSRRVAETVARGVRERMNIPSHAHDLTPAAARARSYAYSGDQLLILSLPVYGGRIPRLMEEMLTKLQGDHTPAVILAVYGNRHYDDALLEMKQLLSAQGFIVVAAAAFIGEHSFSSTLAAQRPDAQDERIALRFAEDIAAKLAQSQVPQEISVPGNTPLKERGPAAVRAPITEESCIHCGICIQSCPVDAIAQDDPFRSDPQACISCCACIKLCPQHSRHFQDEGLLKATAWLESNFAERREPELFI